jgi:Na+-translocating ferredoxin:NAD+ oxidoreductase subunit A
MSWVGIILTFALVDNVILSRLLGVCPAGSPPSGMKAARTIGLFTGLLMSLSSVAGWAEDTLVLIPFGFTFLRTPVFVFTVAGLAFLLQWIAKLQAPGRLEAAGLSMPEVAVNCATLGVVLICTRAGYTAVQCIVAGLSAGLGYFIVTTLLAAIRERLDVEQTPEALGGFPLHLISAGLLAYAFAAFDKAFLLRLLGS